MSSILITVVSCRYYENNFSSRDWLGQRRQLFYIQKKAFESQYFNDARALSLCDLILLFGACRRTIVRRCSWRPAAFLEGPFFGQFFPPVIVQWIFENVASCSGIIAIKMSPLRSPYSFKKESCTTPALPDTIPTPATTKRFSKVDGPVRRKPRLRPMARRKKEKRKPQPDDGGVDDMFRAFSGFHR